MGNNFNEEESKKKELKIGGISHGKLFVFSFFYSHFFSRIFCLRKRRKKPKLLNTGKNIPDNNVSVMYE